MSSCADITAKKATAILLEFPDSHVRNTVITCGYAGVVNRAGGNSFRGKERPQPNSSCTPHALHCGFAGLCTTW